MNTLKDFQAIEFELPANLEAGEPPEARGLARDDVRLMVSYQNSDAILHTTFRYLDHYLEAGDVLIVNTSGTLNAALPALSSDGSQFELQVCGAPSILVVVADNQLNATQQAAQQGWCIMLDARHVLDIQQLVYQVVSMWEDKEELSRMSERAYALADASGAARVVECIRELVMNDD